MTCIRSAPGGQKKLPCLSEFIVVAVEQSMLHCWKHHIFFCWYPPFCLVIKSRQIKSILGKLSKKISNPFCLVIKLSNSFRNQKKSPGFDDLDHPSSTTKWAIQGPGDWSGTQTAAVPGCTAAQGSHWLILKIAHWCYKPENQFNIGTPISGAFLRTCTKKNMWDFVSVFSAELRFPLTIRGRPIFSDHLVVKSICFSWLDPHVGCLANENHRHP